MAKAKLSSGPTKYSGGSTIKVGGGSCSGQVKGLSGSGSTDGWDGHGQPSGFNPNDYSHHQTFPGLEPGSRQDVYFNGFNETEGGGRQRCDGYLFDSHDNGWMKLPDCSQTNGHNTKMPVSFHFDAWSGLWV